MDELHVASTRGFSAEMGVFTCFASTVIETKDGIRLAAEVASPMSPSRGVVVFVHGFGGNKDENGLFRAIANQSLAKGFHTVLYDWRGIGQSEGNFESTTLQEHVGDFERVVEWSRSRFRGSLGLHCAVGFSLGAAVVGLALQRKSPLDRVAYLSPAVRPTLSMWPRYERVWRTVKKLGCVQKPGSSVLLGKPILKSLRDTDLGPQAFNVRVPLLVCHGTKDTRIDCSHTLDLVRARGDASDFRYMQFDGASHSFQPTDIYWTRLASAVSTWFDSASVQPETRH